MMTYVRVYKFDCCSRKNALDFLTNVLKDLHSFIFSGNSFQIFYFLFIETKLLKMRSTRCL